MTGSTRSTAELRKLGEHLNYEMDMLVRTSVLATQEVDEHRRYAFLEAFLVHYRVLAEFLSAKPKKEDDVTAKDFFPAWKSPVKFSDWDDINKSLAHLTTRRIHRTKKWPVQAMTLRMLQVLQEFENALPAAMKKWIQIPEFPRYSQTAVLWVTTASDYPSLEDLRRGL